MTGPEGTGATGDGLHPSADAESPDTAPPHIATRPNTKGHYRAPANAIDAPASRIAPSNKAEIFIREHLLDIIGTEAVRTYIFEQGRDERIDQWLDGAREEVADLAPLIASLIVKQLFEQLINELREKDSRLAYPTGLLLIAIFDKRGAHPDTFPVNPDILREKYVAAIKAHRKNRDPGKDNYVYTEMLLNIGIHIAGFLPPRESTLREIEDQFYGLDVDYDDDREFADFRELFIKRVTNSLDSNDSMNQEILRIRLTQPSISNEEIATIIGCPENEINTRVSMLVTSKHLEALEQNQARTKRKEMVDIIVKLWSDKDRTVKDIATEIFNQLGIKISNKSLSEIARRTGLPSRKLNFDREGLIAYLINGSRKQTGETHDEIATRFGTTRATVSNLASRIQRGLL